MPNGRTVSIDIDRTALQRALTRPTLRANADWCVACGASASTAPELPAVIASELEKEVSPVKTLINTELVERLAMQLSTPDANADWCVACGASGSKAPETLVSNPALSPLTDTEIDAIATRFLSRLQGMGNR